MEKLTSKGKHTIKVGNHPHINMISKPVIMRGGGYKCRIFEMDLKLKDHHLKTILFIYRLLSIYQNLMVTANQKSTTDTHTKKKKESKHNTKVTHQSQEKRTREEGKKKHPKKQIQNN